MSNTDGAGEAYDNLPVESIIALNAAANYLARAPDSSRRLQLVSDIIVKYLKGEVPSLDQALDGKCRIGASARQSGTVAAPLAEETDTQRWVAAAIELLQSVPMVEDKAAQPVTRPLAAASKSGMPAAAMEAPPSMAGKSIVATAKVKVRQPSGKSSLAPIVAVMTGLMLVLVAGGYFLMKEKSLDNASRAVAKSTAPSAVIASKSIEPHVVTEVTPLASAPTKEMPPVVLPVAIPEPIQRQSAQDAKSEKVPTAGSKTVKSASLSDQPAHIASSATKPAAHQAAVVPVQSRMLGDAGAPPRQAPFQLSLSLTPLKIKRTIDEQYKERSAKECRAGLLGLFCREALRLKLCSGKWADDPLHGQTVCKKNNTQKSE